MKIGAYETTGEVGRGAFGVVFAARASDGRQVALKVLAKKTAQAAARFERERRLLALFGEAEGFVPLLDTGESPEGPYIVMPFLAGGTLRDRLERGPLPLEEAVEIGLSLARAVGAAHARGIVHRDLKPENVLFSKKERPLVADLGLAKHFLDDAPEASRSVSLSRPRDMRGTIGYMSPEQMADAKSAGPPTDVFALGAILYECLSGRAAFAGRTVVEVLTAVDACEVVPLAKLRPETPPWLERIVLRALARDQAERFPDGEALARALETKQDRDRESAPRRSAIAIGLAIGVALAGLTLAIALLVVSGSPGTEAVSAPTKPGDAPLVEEASSFLKQRKYREAIASASRALELAPRNARAWHCRGEARVRAGELALAIGDLTKAIELDPKLATAWADRGFARSNLGQLDDGIADLTRAIELDPKQAMTWVARAHARGRKGDRAGQIADCTKAIELDPKLALAWSLRGDGRSNAGDQEGSIADNTRAIELDPKLAIAWAQRGYSRAVKGDYEGEVADCTKAIELDPKLAIGWAYRGNGRGKKGDFDGEIADATRAIELDPRLAQAWAGRGFSRSCKGDADGAMADLTRALELEQHFAAPWANRAVLRAQKDDFEGAVGDFTKAIELDPEAPPNWFNRGVTYMRSGKPDPARKDLEHFLELAPNDDGAGLARQLLEQLGK